jgi:tRNA(fMet)-specific endonuclease VapC
VHIFDTSVVVDVLNTAPSAHARAAQYRDPKISVITAVELQAGLYRARPAEPLQKSRLDAVLDGFDILPFDRDLADAYGRLLGIVGFSRRKVLDRMIAVTVLRTRAVLVTANPADFTDVPGLHLEPW